MKDQPYTISYFSGPEARKYRDDIAAIRIGLFKEFPYLYEGDLTYETEYLETYFSQPNALIMLAFQNNKVVGYSSSVSLADELEEIKAPFSGDNVPLDKMLYIGEAMIYPEFRSKGMFRHFMESHEQKAKTEHFEQIVFMTVDREADHPLRPVDYRELGPIFEYYGYSKIPNKRVHMEWSQVDTGVDTTNTLSLWIKPT
ncbi:GNAT family N-acetyltransferase [Endozoicomonadaceae bacterium StTr2]